MPPPVRTHPRRPVRRTLACTLVALGIAAPARAATIQPMTGGIAVVDRAGRTDTLVIGFPAPETVRVHANAPLTVTPGLLRGISGLVCRRTHPSTAVCRPDDPAMGMRLAINAGGGDDVVRFTRPSSAPGGVLAPRVDGGPGADRITADGALVGGPGDDLLRVVRGGGRAALLGGPGNDVLIGGRGDDALLGGAGDDRLLDPWGVNIFRGGTGRDTALVPRASQAGAVTVAAGGATVGPDPGLSTVWDDVEEVRSPAR